MRIRNCWERYAPIWLQVSWEMKWELFLGFILLVFIGLFIGSIVYTLSHPELIGEFFGKIVKGFNSIQ